MALIGLKGFYIAKYDYNDSTKTRTYTDGKKVAKGVDVNVQYQTAMTPLYADNGKVDSVRAITGVNLTATPHDIGVDLLKLMGLKEETVANDSDSTTLYTIGSDTEGGFIGFAFIEYQKDGRAYKYKAVIVKKAKLYPPESDSAATMQESISFTTPSVVGEGFIDEKDNNYVAMGIFDTEAEAEACINKYLAIGTSTGL